MLFVRGIVSGGSGHDAPAMAVMDLSDGRTVGRDGRTVGWEDGRMAGWQGGLNMPPDRGPLVRMWLSGP